MTDVFPKEKRGWIMSRVHGKDTTPELKIRSMVHRMGFRFRLHRKDLPGKPDLVFPARRCVIFVHGCFWHGHDCKRGRRIPKTNTDYWVTKINRNLDRDYQNRRLLKEQGWSVLVIWACEIKDNPQLPQRIAAFLKGEGPGSDWSLAEKFMERLD